MRRPIQVRLKLDSFFCDFSERPVTKDLISSAVRQNRSLPGHETVKPTLTFDDLLSGAKIEMVGVGQDELNIQIFHNSWGMAFTVPAVPTGIKTGVSISPRPVCSTPWRAWVFLSRASTRKEKDMGNQLTTDN